MLPQRSAWTMLLKTFSSISSWFLEETKTSTESNTAVIQLAKAKSLLIWELLEFAPGLICMDNLSPHHLGGLQLIMLHIQALTSYPCPHSLLGNHCISPIFFFFFFFPSSEQAVLTSPRSFTSVVTKMIFLFFSLQDFEITGTDLFTEHQYVLK